MPEYIPSLGAIQDELSGEGILWAGDIEVAIFAPTGWTLMPARAAITPTRLIWTLFERPEVILLINFADVLLFDHDYSQKSYFIQTKPANYPEELLEHNPEGIVEFSFRTLDTGMHPILVECIGSTSKSPTPNTNNGHPQEEVSGLLGVNAKGIDRSRIASAESLEIVNALDKKIGAILTEGERVISAAEATWKDQADLAGPGCFQGALLCTNTTLHFLYSSLPRAQFSEVHEIRSISLSNISGGKKVRTYLTMRNGFRAKAPRPNSHHLTINVRTTEGQGHVLAFIVRPNRLNEILKFLKNAR